MRTDQLDGETDWKLRVAVPLCQRLPSDQVSVLDVLLSLFLYGRFQLLRYQILRLIKFGVSVVLKGKIATGLEPTTT